MARGSSVAVSVLLALGCACGSVSPSADAGTDSVVDAVTDTGDDGGARDAETDTGVRDARDSGIPPDADVDPEGWVPLPGLPEGCVVERAEDPERVFSAVWENCGDGCQVLTQDPSVQRSFSTGRPMGDPNSFTIVQTRRTDPEQRRMLILARLDGPAFAAWRGPRISAPGVCSAGFLASGDGHAAFLVGILGDTWPRQERIYHGSLDDIGDATEPVAVLEAPLLFGSNSIQNMAVSSTTVAAELQPSGEVVVIEGGSVRRLGGASSPVNGIPQNVQVVGRDVFWEDWGPPVRLAHGRMDLEEHVLLDLGDVSVTGVSITAERVAFQHAADLGDTGWRDVDLWRSPFAVTTAGLAPERVADLPGNGRFVGGPSLYVEQWRDETTRWLELYDLSDGTLRRLDPPGDYRLMAPLHVTSEEVLMGVSLGSDPSLMRIQLASVP